MSKLQISDKCAAACYSASSREQTRRIEPGLPGGVHALPAVIRLLDSIASGRFKLALAKQVGNVSTLGMEHELNWLVDQASEAIERVGPDVPWVDPSLLWRAKEALEAGPIPSPDAARFLAHLSRELRESAQRGDLPNIPATSEMEYDPAAAWPPEPRLESTRPPAFVPSLKPLEAAPKVAATNKRAKRNQGKAAACKGHYVGCLERGELPPGPTELARIVNCSPSTASRAIQDLEGIRKAHAQEDAGARYNRHA